MVLSIIPGHYARSMMQAGNERSGAISESLLAYG
jgi:hypothetical protein